MTWRPDFGLLCLALLVVGGRRFWLLTVLPLLVGLPLTLVAIFLGMRVIAGEIDARSLEIANTVPGGCERVWWAKLVASGLVLVAAETLLAATTYMFFTSFPWSALYGAMQAALFYLVLSMGMATLFRSEAAGAMAIAAILGFNGLTTGFGDTQVRISPFWSPHALEDAGPVELLAWTLQNRIGIVLAMAAILALAFMRANRRERMLGA